MILHIDTKNQKIIKVSLKKDLPAGRQVVKFLSEENEYGSQVLLPLIGKLLDQHTEVELQFHPRGGATKKWKLLKGIEVETGPGSFTGLRVGVSVANALGFSLGIPVNGKKMEVELNY